MEIVYGTGWDPERRVFAGVFPVQEAQRRDAADEPYSFVIFALDRPYAVVDRHGWYLVIWLLDSAGRRITKADFRRTEPGRFRLHKVFRWQYQPDDAEFGDLVCRWRWEIRDTEPMSVAISEPGGDRGRRRDTFYPIDPGRLWHTAPVFGAWSTLPALPAACFAPDLLGESQGSAAPSLDPVPLLTGIDPATPVDPMVVDLSLVEDEPATGLWQRPAGARPGDFDAWFTDGVAILIDDQPVPVPVRIVTVGMLRMPTGRFMATEPGWSTDHFEAFTVTVPPGSYPVELSVTYWNGGVALGANAMRMRISSEPAREWELALRPGQDIRLLDDDHYYGFGVDGGMASLLDEAAFPVIEALSGADVDADAAYRWVTERGYADLDLSGLTANVIATVTANGDGLYPTWIGRDDAGDVCCVVVDLEGLHDARIVLP